MTNVYDSYLKDRRWTSDRIEVRSEVFGKELVLPPPFPKVPSGVVLNLPTYAFWFAQ